MPEATPTWELFLLALCIYREASNQPYEAKLGVAWSIANRVSRPRWWGHNWTEVITLKDQYTSMTWGGDPNLTRWPSGINDPVWFDCLRAAAAAMRGGVGEDPVRGATHYFDQSIPAPRWTKVPTSQHMLDIGAFQFWRVE